MGHYAFLDASNVVVGVITGREDAGADWESFYAASRGVDASRCKRTSYNTRAGSHVKGGAPFRKNYAGVGFTYDAERDAFIPPKPFPSWTLDETSCDWASPIPYPEDGGRYVWNESSQGWVPA
jgi:hypothetical protein